MSTFNHLFESFTFNKGITLRNKVVMSPMTTWSSNDDYTVSDEEVAYYKKRVNGVGMVIMGCTHVMPNGIGFTHEFAGYEDSFISSLKKLADAAKSGGAPAILQLFHAGDKALAELIPGGDVVSPSGIALTETTSTRELTHEEIVEIIQAFGGATRRGIEAGEKYSTKPFILGYRISPEEHQQDALRMTDTYALMDRLVEEEFDYIHASLVQALSSKPKYDSSDKATYLELIVEYADKRIPVIAAGSLESPEDVAESIEKGLSLAVIGRALVADPNWVEKVQQGKESEIQTAVQSAKIHDLALPTKLRGVMQNAGPWFKIEN